MIVCVDKVINYISIYEEKTVKLLNVLVISFQTFAVFYTWLWIRSGCVHKMTARRVGWGREN